MAVSTLATSRQEVGSPTALDATTSELIARHATRVWRSLKYLGVADQDLPDACQEVFLIMHRKNEGFLGASTYQTWVYGICIGVARNVRRSRRREAARFVDVDLEPSYWPKHENSLDLERTRAHLQWALDQLSDEQREVFVLKEIEENSMSHVARLLRCPLFTAYSRLRLAKRRLRQLLEEGERA